MNASPDVLAHATCATGICGLQRVRGPTRCSNVCKCASLSARSPFFPVDQRPSEN
eukprot:CAMPEP_0195100968 /NCGR_PEP_ID=MMETSP0448-20130528/64838_1 /TAXON_ID=66468 /ORGANISM="Heterocapsa triquestra, Strain CCMP 448" /LENGTH=54 /DNA_ID=CAMNT_0040136207 /DNA_START=38 /DNA_END=202 /DNA_ORIENTATION=+